MSSVPLHYESDDDAQLVERLSGGDRQALAALYDRYARLVFSVAVRVLRDRSQAEDVMQEIFLQLLRRPGFYDASRGPLGPWLAVLTRNRCIDALRRAPSRWETLEVDLPSLENFEESAVQKATASKVKEVLSGLEQSQRTALELAVFEGKTHTEIAAATGWPVGTVKTRIRSALKQIRNRIR